MSRMQEEINQSATNADTKVYAGIDVGKHALDVFIHPLNLRCQVSNDASGLNKLVRLCTRHGVDLIALKDRILRPGVAAGNGLNVVRYWSASAGKVKMCWERQEEADP